MTDRLTLVADADQIADLSTLPADCEVVLGYVGQPLCTPHIWTTAEVKAVRATGRAWAPIHTPPPGAFDRTSGQRAAALMLQEIARYPLLGPEPMFLDIEHASWAVNPHMTMLGVQAWRDGMHAAGHGQAWAYLPWQAGTEWGANWVNYRPDSIPAGYAGWQFDHSHPGRHYDLSVFRPTVFADLIAATKGHPMNLDHDAQQFIVDQLTKVATDLHDIVWAYYDDPNPKAPHPYANRRLAERLDHLQAEVAKLTVVPVDVATLAADLAADLGPRLAADLVAELSRRLAS